MQVEFVKDFNLFLEKAEYGTNHTYQLHRELGGVFVEASFVDESLCILFKTRVEANSPKIISSVLKWDDHNFPYEIETYLIGDEEVVVPFYYPTDTGWRSFMLDIIESLKEMIDAPSILECRCLSSTVGVPDSIVVKLYNLIQKIGSIARFLNEQRDLLDIQEQRAIERYFGDCGFWETIEENDVIPTMATYLSAILMEESEDYKKIRESEIEKRRKILIDAENRIVSNIEKNLKNHKFKKGYVS